MLPIPSNRAREQARRGAYELKSLSLLCSLPQGQPSLQHPTARLRVGTEILGKSREAAPALSALGRWVTEVGKHQPGIDLLQLGSPDQVCSQTPPSNPLGWWEGEAAMGRAGGGGGCAQPSAV